MADPFDIANLWWLRPRNPQGSSSLPAFALGARIQQDRIQNDIDTKRMLLDQQYRMENLRAQERWTDARIQNYESLAQQRRDEESDMEELTKIMGPMSEGKSFDAPQFRTERGTRAFAQLNNSFSLQRSRSRLTTEALKQQREYDDKLSMVKQYAQDVFAAIYDQVKQSGAYSPEMIAQIDDIYNREIRPRLTEAPAGMEPKAIRQNLPGGEHVTFGPKVSQRTERLPQAHQDRVTQLYRQRRAEIAKFNADRLPSDKYFNKETDEESMRWAENAATRAEQAASVAPPDRSSATVVPAFRFDPITKKLLRIQ